MIIFFVIYLILVAYFIKNFNGRIEKFDKLVIIFWPIFLPIGLVIIFIKSLKK